MCFFSAMKPSQSSTFPYDTNPRRQRWLTLARLRSRFTFAMIIKRCNNVKSSRSPTIPTNSFSMEVSLYPLDFIPLTCIYTPPQSVRCIVYLFCFAELLGFVQKLSSNHGNFSDPELKTGRCKQSLQTRLFCFWEGWNYKKGKGSERIGVDMVLIDHNQHPPLPNFELNVSNNTNI